LITFEADSFEQAEGIIAADPFVQEELLESSVVKQWMPEYASTQRSWPAEGVDEADPAGHGGPRRGHAGRLLERASARRFRKRRTERGWVTARTVCSIDQFHPGSASALFGQTAHLILAAAAQTLCNRTPHPFG
jgi:hypothetical protein